MFTYTYIYLYLHRLLQIVRTSENHDGYFFSENHEVQIQATENYFYFCGKNLD